MRKEELISSITAIVVSVAMASLMGISIIVITMFNPHHLAILNLSAIESVIFTISILVLYSVTFLSFLIFIMGIVGLCTLNLKIDLSIGLLVIYIIITLFAMLFGLTQTILSAIRGFPSAFGIALAIGGIIALAGMITQVILFINQKNQKSISTHQAE